MFYGVIFMLHKLKSIGGILGLILIIGVMGKGILEDSGYDFWPGEELDNQYEHLMGDERPGLESVSSIEENGKTVVIDPGHGGYDPGKVGANGALEKDINLNISLKVEAMLKEQGYKVIMTRTTDSGMTENGNELGKTSDLDARASVINESHGDMAISIHQNSYTTEDVKGAQVFYYEASETGGAAAAIMQESLREIDPANHRQIKANTSYYLLKRTTIPTIIVECGFLSNMNEANLLCDDTYQMEMAMAIVAGVSGYLGVL